MWVPRLYSTDAPGFRLQSCRLCARRVTITNGGSHGKVSGFVWDLFGMREMKKEQANQELSFGPYRLDSERVQLWRGVQEVRLTGKAFAVLRYFVEHPGQLVTKDELLQAVWPQTVVTESTLASCIQELRQALRDDAKKPRYIETVHRRGYRWIAAIAPQANEPVFHFETTADPPSPLPPLSSPPIPGEGHTARLSPFSPSPEAEEEKEENSSPAVHSLF